MKVNHKQMYAILKQQVKVLKNQLNPESNVEKVNEIPENFNQVGWDSTIEKVEQLLAKMKELREIKGKRLTPQFYRSIYNRALIGANEIDKLMDTLISDDAEIDFESECVKLNAEIYQLNIQLAEKEKQEAEKAEKENEKVDKEENKKEILDANPKK